MKKEIHDSIMKVIDDLEKLDGNLGDYTSIDTFSVRRELNKLTRRIIHADARDVYSEKLSDGYENDLRKIDIALGFANDTVRKS